MWPISSKRLPATISFFPFSRHTQHIHTLTSNIQRYTWGALCSGF